MQPRIKESRNISCAWQEKYNTFTVQLLFQFHSGNIMTVYFNKINLQSRSKSLCCFASQRLASCLILAHAAVIISRITTAINLLSWNQCRMKLSIVIPFNQSGVSLWCESLTPNAWNAWNTGENLLLHRDTSYIYSFFWRRTGKSVASKARVCELKTRLHRQKPRLH